MITQIANVIEAVVAKSIGYVWNYPVVILCLFGAVYFSFRLRFVQIKSVKHAFHLLTGKFDEPGECGQISHFQALSAALSGTIGLGNIAGVALAIGLGGPGAIFWMWIVAFFGMATKYVECTLGTYYRDKVTETGEVRGGPMHYITRGLGEKWRPVGSFYAICMFIGAFGVGNMFQSNQTAIAFLDTFGTPTWVTGILLAALVAVVIVGGIQRIGQVASKIVPFMCCLYIFGSLFICVQNIHLIGTVFEVILRDAFTGMAAAGGSVGTVVIWGVRRAIFSNEAGLGTASMAHAAVKTDYPIRQGIVASLEPFIDTIIVCTVTAMLIITSGFFGTEVYQPLNDKTITFEKNHPTLYGGSDWRITNKAPENVPELQRVRASDHVLMHTGKSKTLVQLPGITVNNKNKVAEGIRFSYYKKSGDMTVRLTNEKEELLASIPLNEGTQIVADNNLVKVQGTIKTDEWQSIVLRFSDMFKENIRDNTIASKIYIQFLPSTTSEENEWYFDRVQAVENTQGIILTTKAFQLYFGKYAQILISIAVFFFAFSTVITFYYYGETSVRYVFKGKIAPRIYKYTFITGCFIGAVNAVSFVLNFSDLILGLMVVPNMIALVILVPKVSEWTQDYFNKLKTGEISETKSEKGSTTKERHYKE